MDTKLLSTLLLDAVSDLFFLVRVESHDRFFFEQVNKGYLTSTGYKEEDVIGNSVANLLPSDVVDFVISRFQETMRLRRKITYEEPVRFSGTPLIMETTLYPFYDEQGAPEYILGVCRDITQRKKAGLDLEESRQRYRSLFHHNPNGSFAMDTNGRFTEVNRPAETLTGYSNEEIVGFAFDRFLLSDDLETAKAAFNAVLKGESVNVELTVIHKSGHHVQLHVLASPIIVNGEIIGLIGIAKDITEQKRSEQTLRESEERFRVLVQLSPDAIIIQADGLVMFCNDAAARMVGVSHPDELLGAHIDQFIPPDEIENMHQAIQRIYDEKKAAQPFELKIKNAGGGYIDAEGTAAAITYEGKMMLQVVFRDISKRKIEEEHLKRLAQLDGLTNVSNRRFFESSLNKEVQRAMRSRCPVSLILFDIDFFKAYNDYYGHVSGDECLKIVVEAAQSALKRPGDLISRYGGEEFAVLLPETDERGARHIAELVRHKVESLRVEHDTSPLKQVTISLGAATDVPDKGYDPKRLIRLADEALYLAKRNGKNRFETARWRLCSPSDSPSTGF